MRNLVLSAIKISSLESKCGQPDSTAAASEESIIAAAFDIDRGLIFSASEDAQRGVCIWRAPVDPCEWNAPILCGSFNSANVLSLRVIGETAQLILVTRSGDTVSWELDDSGDFIVRPTCMVDAVYTDGCRVVQKLLEVLIQAYWQLNGVLMIRFLLLLLVSVNGYSSWVCQRYGYR